MEYAACAVSTVLERGKQVKFVVSFFLLHFVSCRVNLKATRAKERNRVERLNSVSLSSLAICYWHCVVAFPELIKNRNGVTIV